MEEKVLRTKKNGKYVSDQIDVPRSWICTEPKTEAPGLCASEMISNRLFKIGSISSNSLGPVPHRIRAV